MSTPTVSTKRFAVNKIENGGQCAIVTFEHEDHTLGNAARHMMMKNPNVKFCGYSLPHPNERKVVMQIQMWPNKGNAIDALETGLRNLTELCQHVKSTFDTAFEEFAQQQAMDES